LEGRVLEDENWFNIVGNLSFVLVTDGVSTPPALDLVSWSLGSISDASRRFVRQLELAARNGTTRLLGILKVSLPLVGKWECLGWWSCKLRVWWSGRNVRSWCVYNCDGEWKFWNTQHLVATATSCGPLKRCLNVSRAVGHERARNSLDRILNWKLVLKQITLISWWQCSPYEDAAFIN
jgi:hypothetical protein